MGRSWPTGFPGHQGLREQAYVDQINAANEQLASSYSLDDVNAIEKAYSKQLTDASDLLDESYDDIGKLEGNIKQLREQVRVLLDREDDFLQQIEEANNLLNPDDDDDDDDSDTRDARKNDDDDDDGDGDDEQSQYSATTNQSPDTPQSAYS